TMSGMTARTIAATMAEYQGGTVWPPKDLLLFDSFEGLPEAAADADKEAPLVRSGVWGPGTCQGLTQRQLERLCRTFLPTSRLKIYRGWSKDTMPLLPPQTMLAMLHIDSDLYQSAIDVLHHAFAHGMVQEGAIVLFDDWDSNRASPDFGERRAWREACDRF